MPGGVGRLLEDGTGGDRRQRQGEVVVADVERTARALHAQLALIEHLAVLVAEDGQQDRAAKLGFRRVPVDVEVTARSARLAEAQHVPPPRVGRGRGRHVVGHDVDDQPEVMLVERRHEAGPALVTAELVADLGRVDHVVAVLAAGRRLEDRGAVDVADAQLGQVGHDGGGGVEPELGAEL